MKTLTDPCEDFLRAEKASFLDQRIWPSKVAIIDRLLADSLNLLPVYAELRRRLPDPAHWARVLEIAIEAAYFYSPEATSEVRDSLRRVQEMNREIGKLSSQLAELMRRRRELCNDESIHGSDLYSLPQAIGLAGEANDGRYRSYLKAPLDALAGQFDGKYWPAIEDLVDLIAEDAFATDVHFHDQVTQAAVGSPKRSKLDYLRGFRTALEESTGCSYAGCLPRDFRLTDSMTAALLNACYGEELFEASAVKRARQEDRQRGARDSGFS